MGVNPNWSGAKVFSLVMGEGWGEGDPVSGKTLIDTPDSLHIP